MSAFGTIAANCIRQASVVLFTGVLSVVVTSASVGQSILLPGGDAPGEGDAEAQAAVGLLELFKRKWPEIEQTSNKQTPLRCAGPDIPVANLDPKVAYQGEGIVGSAASPNGVVAVANIAKQQLLVFPEGIDRPAAPPISLGGPFGSVILSNDGRYLAWSDGFRVHIYDIPEKRGVGELDIMIAGLQWIGDDLLIKPNFFNSKEDNNSLFLMKREGGDFRKTVLTDHLYGLNKFGLPDIKQSFDRIARADQLGQSFVGSEKIYTSIADALTDNAVVEPDDHELSLRTLRLDHFLLRVNLYETSEELRTHKQAVWSLNLLSGASGKEIASRTLPKPWCRPRDIAVASDGKTFATLVGAETVVIVDSRDLSYRSAYNLLSLRGSVPLSQSIALLPDNRILVTTQDALIVYDPTRSN